MADTISPIDIHANFPLLLVGCCCVVVGMTAVVALLPAKIGSTKEEANPKSASASQSSRAIDILLSTRMNIRRKVQHVTSGLVLLFLYLFVATPFESASILLLASVGLFLLHHARLHSPAIQRGMLKAFGSLIRPHELYSLPGAFWMVLGCGLCVGIFRVLLPPTDIDEVHLDIPGICILILSVGDPLASFVGLLLSGLDIDPMPKRFRVQGKSLTAALVMCVVSTMATYQFTWWSQCQNDLTAECALRQHQRVSSIWLWSFVASLTGSLVEFFNLFGLDDNFRIPIMTGSIIWILQQIF